MLVLTRKAQEQIVIGPDVTITVLRIKGNTVRIGVSAPRNVRVVRGELPHYGASREAHGTTENANAPTRAGNCGVPDCEGSPPPQSPGEATDLGPIVRRVTRRFLSSDAARPSVTPPGPAPARTELSYAGTGR